MLKEWKEPQIQEIRVKEDSTSSNCGGKKIGCYAGSSCGSVEIRKRSSSTQKKKC